MAEHEIMVHQIDYLSVSKGKIDGEPVVIITIRPDLPSTYRPHNLAIIRSQGERLLEDLKNVLSRSGVWLLMLALARLTRCSADVEVERETTSTRTAAAEAESHTLERSRTAVAVNFLKDQGSILMEDGKPVDVPSEAAILLGLSA